MKRAQLALLAVLTAMFFGVAVREGDAQLQQVAVRVDGLACPFCAYGLEKNLKALKGVESVDISLDEGVATLVVKSEETLSLDRLNEAVKDAGFTPRETRLTASGHVATLDELADDEEAMKAIAEIQAAAKEQGIDLPTNSFVLVLDTPRQVFLLLRGEEEASQRSFGELQSAVTGSHTVTIIGTIPEMNEGSKRVPGTVFVESVEPEDVG